MKTLKQLCVPRDTIFDAAKRDTVISINQLIRGQVDPEQFFSENYMTQGMRLLLENCFKRLEGKSDQGVFRLTQSMGGGKTHNLNALGLLARFRLALKYHKIDKVDWETCSAVLDNRERTAYLATGW